MVETEAIQVVRGTVNEIVLQQTEGSESSFTDKFDFAWKPFLEYLTRNSLKQNELKLFPSLMAS